MRLIRRVFNFFIALVVLTAAAHPALASSQGHGRNRKVRRTITKLDARLVPVRLPEINAPTLRFTAGRLWAEPAPWKADRTGDISNLKVNVLKPRAVRRHMFESSLQPSKASVQPRPEALRFKNLNLLEAGNRW